jgi:hypothetical protein
MTETVLDLILKSARPLPEVSGQKSSPTAEREAEDQPERQPPVKVTREPFAKVELSWLTTYRSVLGRVYSARSRLWHYLLIKTRHGQRQTRVTNDDAAELGLTKQSKMRELRCLEKAGLIATHMNGNRAPLVSVLLPNTNDVTKAIPPNRNDVDFEQE